MFYIIYKITNRVNNKIYIGKHKTSELNDDYMGSGLILKRAIEKYGIDKFDKEILYIYDNEVDMNNMEAEIVNEEFLLREDVYNLKLGGQGGFDFINENNLSPLNPTSINYFGNAKKTEYSKQYGYLGGEKHKILFETNEEYKKQILEKICFGLKQYYKDNPGTFTNKKHTDESKRKIGQANKIKQKGNLNSQFGKCWITNSIENKLIKKEQLEEYIIKGWIKGRVNGNKNIIK